MNCCHFKANFYTSPGFEPVFGGTERIVPGLGTIAAIGEHYKELAWFQLVVKQSTNSTSEWDIVTEPNAEAITAAETAGKLVGLLVTRLDVNNNNIGEIRLLETVNGYFTGEWSCYICSAIVLSTGDIPPITPPDIDFPVVPIQPNSNTSTRTLAVTTYHWSYQETNLIQDDEVTIIDGYTVLSHGASEQSVTEVLSKKMKVMFARRLGYIIYDGIFIPLKTILNTQGAAQRPTVFIFETLYNGYLYRITGSFESHTFNEDSNCTWRAEKTVFSNTNIFYFDVYDGDDGPELVSMPSVKSVYDMYSAGSTTQAALYLNESTTYILNLQNVSTSLRVANNSVIGNVVQLTFGLTFNNIESTLIGSALIYVNGNISDESWEISTREVSYGSNVNYGSGLAYDSSTNTLSVDVTTAVESDNTKPITSGAVYVTVGNINALLETI